MEFWIGQESKRILACTTLSEGRDQNFGADPVS